MESLSNTSDLVTTRFHDASLKPHLYTPKIEFCIERKNYLVKTASTFEEYKQAFRLRFDCYYGNASQNFIGYDYDLYDQIGDLIVIKNTDLDKVIGTYRVISSRFASQFYSQSEFDISLFTDTYTNLVEVSRACTHEDFRNGISLSLLWQGIMEYVRILDATHLFGCSSIWTEDKCIVKALYDQFQSDGTIKKDYSIKPLAKYDRNINASQPSQGEIKHLIPPLLKTYLKAGAKIYGPPAYDGEFRCFDFFTILNIAHIREKYRKKYC